MKYPGFKLLNHICDSLGLSKKVVSLTIVLKLNEAPRLIVEQRLTDEQTEVLGSVFEHKEYELIEKETALVGDQS